MNVAAAEKMEEGKVVDFGNVEACVHLEMSVGVPSLCIREKTVLQYVRSVIPRIVDLLVLVV